jgi:Interferon-induced transmembrane protein/WW domain
MGIDPSGDRENPLISDPFNRTTQMKNEQIPPPPPSDLNYLSIPPGWATATSPHDGRVYYWEKSTGKTSWTLPSKQQTYQPNVDMSPSPTTAPIKPSMRSQPSANATSTRSMDRARSGIIASRSMNENISYDYDMSSGYSQRPTAYQCYAIVAIILFFPLGLFALIYSLKVESAWTANRTVDSFRYSRRALLFSRVATAFGAVFWIWFIFFRGPGGFDLDFRPIFEW